MTLTPQQLSALRGDLDKFVRLDYDHLRDELLDHYATLTEAKMTTGLTFQEASNAAWLALGDSEGIQKIQTTYEIVIGKQIRAHHRTILLGFLRWPTILTGPLLIGLITYLILTLPLKLATALTGLIVAVPMLMMLTVSVLYYIRRDSHRKPVWLYVIQRGLLPIIVLNWLNTTGILASQEISRTAMGYLLLLAGVSLVQTISLAQLMRAHFFVKLT